MRVVYNILFTFFFLLSSPFYFLKMWRRGNWKKGFGQRFGSYSSKIKQAVTNRNVVWFHAVSVGEVNVCTQLIKALEAKMPAIKILVSTTTSTGMEELARQLPLHIEKIYYPIDFPSNVSTALALFHPKAIVLVEAEIWPNFLWEARRREIPVFLVNARLSPRSYRGYKRFGFLFRPIFQRFAGVGCQNEEDAKKLADIGFPRPVIHVVGNLKFDSAKLIQKSPLDVRTMLSQLGFPENAPLLVAGSTHDGEELILARILKNLMQKFPSLKLILVPRHFERGKEVGNVLRREGINFVYRSEVSATTSKKPGEVDCLLVNSTGELRYFYEFATIVFVGKSLTASGGQNPIEPGALAKPILFGPHMENFDKIASALVQRHGAIQVSDEKDLEQQIARLLSDEALRESIGNAARTIVEENKGSAERTVDMIVNTFGA
ncbi:MAG: 3-deoxy-D-manno-octulosonic acid transferase [Verrucomicrobiales bacterium]|nr:3-deoxy-D-manno-octulosonic acid transferase [Verrucomicrobiales bacterium]